MIFRPNTPLMRRYDLVTDGETEACTSRASFGEAGLDKFIKNGFQLSVWNARALIQDRDDRTLGIVVQGDGNRASFRSKLDRIAEQVANHLLDFRRIAQHVS
jgi:hypothetical protein